MGAYVPVDIPEQWRIVVKPFRAVVGEVTMFGIVPVICAERLRVFRVVESTLYDPGCCRVGVFLASTHNSLLPLIKQGVCRYPLDERIVMVDTRVEEDFPCASAVIPPEIIHDRPFASPLYQELVGD